MYNARETTEMFKATVRLARKTAGPNTLSVGLGMGSGYAFATGNNAAGLVAAVLALSAGVATAMQGRGLESHEIGLGENDEPHPPSDYGPKV